MTHPTHEFEKDQKITSASANHFFVRFWHFFLKAEEITIHKGKVEAKLHSAGYQILKGSTAQRQGMPFKKTFCSQENNNLR